MATLFSEKVLVQAFINDFGKAFSNLVEELYIPVIKNIYFNNYLEDRKYIRIDLASFDNFSDSLIFIEAENGLYIQHPQIYLPFCNYLYILAPFDHSPYREKQLQWCEKEGIGVIELHNDGAFSVTLEPKYHDIYPNIKAYVKARIIKRLRRARKCS